VPTIGVFAGGTAGAGSPLSTPELQPLIATASSVLAHSHLLRIRIALSLRPTNSITQVLT
jgi:hypothetical protein